MGAELRAGTLGLHWASWTRARPSLPGGHLASHVLGRPTALQSTVRTPRATPRAPAACGRFWPPGRFG
eukprot:9938994-Lingulodinium_polyedra.AAC.1